MSILTEVLTPPDGGSQRKEPTLTDHRNPSATPQPSTEVDPDLIEVAREVFELARRGDAATLAVVIEKGVPPNLRNEKGDSLLMLAAYHGHVDAVRTLAERGADPNLRNDNGQTPIAGAAFKGFKGVVETLLAHGADVEGASPDGRTALMIAAMFNRTEIVDLLIANGANPNARDAGGFTPLDAANKMGAPDTPAILAKAKS
ncbi:ankyrin repeat protein [Paraburkholderia sp. GAS42]|jgi:ankyrin repeat protein